MHLHILMALLCLQGSEGASPLIPTARQAGALQFERLPGRDLPGLFDYRCARSVSALGCVRSVLDEQEAAAICSADVLGPEHAWTGAVLTWGRHQVRGRIRFRPNFADRLSYGSRQRECQNFVRTVTFFEEGQK
jgi:hypothetical protein